MALHTLCFSVAIILTLIGVWMQWHAPTYRMIAEEAMKDGELTHDQVNRRLRALGRTKRACTLAGMVLLVVSLMWVIR
jgi:hypothetical protein